MRLFHYTTIETLALILANRTIRFTRLDQLDDLQGVEIYASEVTKQVFVSCWTQEEEESISQWALYGGNKRGVLIGLDGEYIEFPDPVISIKECNIEHFVMKNQISNNDSFPVKYVSLEELQIRAKEIVKVNEVGGVSVYGQLGDIKSLYWEFQQERRYSVMVNKNPDLIARDNQSVAETIKPELTYVDLPLKNGFENDITVVLGPLCSPADKIVVESLLNNYGVQNTLRDSRIKKILRK